ncbi:MAG: preprotein translocase subunit SecY [Limnohabitans sp.]|jgi:preprotein translocase subunit SecY|nr:preprotein translocase subunit SecY [Limnohabitans sp.]
MLQAFANIFKIPELRRRVFFTLGMIAIYRIGFVIPLVGVDQTALKELAKKATSEGDIGGFGRIVEYASIFSGGSLQQSTIFGLGIMPYITASIIFQLLTTVWKPLQDLKKDGISGQTKINEYTRYTTVALCFIQGAMWLGYLRSQGLIAPGIESAPGGLIVFYAAGIAGLTAGSLFLMWLGEQIDKYGIGNGISLILTAGILARMPDAVKWVAQNFGWSIQGDTTLTPVGLILLLAGFVFVVAGAVIITVAQRRIPIQQAKHTRGRKVYGGQRQYLPLRINHAGVMPIVFASSLMIFPSSIFGWLATRARDGNSADWWQTVTNFFAMNSQMGEFPYIFVEILMIFFFSYFWTTVQFSPEDMSKQLKQSGAFIPGYRPGPRTAEYLETVMERITYVGAAFLAAIAILPTVISSNMGIPQNVSQFLGGTGLLIVVSVGLDLIQRIEANLLMRNYSGFLARGANDSKAPRVRSRQG